MDLYLNRVRRFWNSFKGRDLASLISIRDSHFQEAELQNASLKEVEQWLQDDGHLCPLAVYHLKVVASLCNRDYHAAYIAQFQVLKAFRVAFAESNNSAWLLPLMSVILRDARDVAVIANDKLPGAKPGEILEKCETELKEMFRVCSGKYNAPEDTNKKRGLLLTVNQMIKLYFRLNNLDLCNPVVRVINSLIDGGMHFDKANLVTYKYYLGRIAILKLDFKQAEAHLGVAFKKCHKDSTSNKRKILLNLIPVKMLYGYMPSVALLERYSLKIQFEKLVNAVKAGNIKSFKEAFKEQEDFFIQTKTALAIEHLMTVVYRNLFKKVYRITGIVQIPISAFEKALKMSGQDVDSHETAAIAVSLIYQGKMKGYVAHKQQKVVLSKQSPFPPLPSTSIQTPMEMI